MPLYTLFIRHAHVFNDSFFPLSFFIFTHSDTDFKKIFTRNPALIIDYRVTIGFFSNFLLENFFTNTQQQ
jgi:hypothetical protein